MPRTKRRETLLREQAAELDRRREWLEPDVALLRSAIMRLDGHSRMADHNGWPDDARALRAAAQSLRITHRALGLHTKNVSTRALELMAEARALAAARRMGLTVTAAAVLCPGCGQAMTARPRGDRQVWECPGCELITMPMAG